MLGYLLYDYITQKKCKKDDIIFTEYQVDELIRKAVEKGYQKGYKRGYNRSDDIDIESQKYKYQNIHYKRKTINKLIRKLQRNK